MKKIIAWIIIIAGLVALALYSVSEGASVQGKDDVLTVTLDTARDSVWVVFSYPDNNAYDSTLCLPAADSVTESKYLISLEPVELDSIGCHGVIARTFTSDTQTADTLIDQWCNFGSILAEPGTGFKTYPCTLEVLQTTDSSATAGVFITVRPLGGGAPFAMGTTDANGLFYYSSEIASVSAFLYKQGENTNAEDTVVIAGSQTDSLYSTTIVPPAPAADMVTIVAGLITANFDTLNPTHVYWRPVKSTGKQYKLSDQLYYGSGANAISVSKEWTIETSTTSTFTFGLFANANLSDTLSQYEFIFHWIDGRVTKVIIAVPDQDSFKPFTQ